MPPSTHIVPEFYIFGNGRGAYLGNGSDNAGTKLISKNERCLVPVGSWARPWASPCILTIPQYQKNERTQEHEPNKLPGGSILYMGEEGSPTPLTQFSFLVYLTIVL